jgi:RimJ/RimL family protein N-acetyltransferase
VRLEPFGAEHLPQTLDWLQDPVLRAQIDSRDAPTQEGHVTYWSRRLADPDDEPYAVLAGPAHVGNGGLMIDRTESTVEIWLYLGDRRGSGIGRRAADALLERGFSGLGLTSAVVRVVSDNSGALRFWRSLGFVDRSPQHADDRRASSVWLSLARSDRMSRRP